MRSLIWLVPAGLVLWVGCQRPDVEAFKKQPAPMDVRFVIPQSVPQQEDVEREYAAALRARLATRTMVVPEGVKPPEGAATLRVQITELRPVGASQVSPAGVGVATGLAVGALSALSGNRDAVFDGFFWGLWAGQEASFARYRQEDQARRLGFQPQWVEAQVAVLAAGNPEPLLTFAVEPEQVINAMDPLSRSERDDELRIREEEARALARVVVARVQSEFGWFPLAKPSYWQAPGKREEEASSPGGNPEAKSPQAAPPEATAVPTPEPPKETPPPPKG